MPDWNCSGRQSQPHRGVTAAPSLSRWNLCSQSSAAGLEALSCPSGPTRSTAPTGRDPSGQDDPAVPADDIPLTPDPPRLWAQLPLGQAQGTGWKSTLASPGSSQAVPAHGSFSSHGISSGAPRMPNVQQNSSTNPWKIKTLMCLQSGPQSHRSCLRVLAGAGLIPEHQAGEAKHKVRFFFPSQCN